LNIELPIRTVDELKRSAIIEALLDGVEAVSLAGTLANWV